MRQLLMRILRTLVSLVASVERYVISCALLASAVAGLALLSYYIDKPERLNLKEPLQTVLKLAFDRHAPLHLIYLIVVGVLAVIAALAAIAVVAPLLRAAGIPVLTLDQVKEFLSEATKDSDGQGKFSVSQLVQSKYLIGAFTTALLAAVPTTVAVVTTSRVTPISPSDAPIQVADIKKSIDELSKRIDGILPVMFVDLDANSAGAGGWTGNETIRTINKNFKALEENLNAAVTTIKDMANKSAQVSADVNSMHRKLAGDLETLSGKLKTTAEQIDLLSGTVKEAHDSAEAGLRKISVSALVTTLRLTHELESLKDRQVQRGMVMDANPPYNVTVQGDPRPEEFSIKFQRATRKAATDEVPQEISIKLQPAPAKPEFAQ